MKILRDHWPVVFEVLEYANKKISQYHIGDFCCLEVLDSEYNNWYYASRPYGFKNEDIDAGQIFRVVEIQLGSFSRSLFSSNSLINAARKR